MKVDTVKVKTDSEIGFKIINVGDISPDDEPFSDEDALKFPVASSQDKKLSEVYDSNIKKMASKIASLEKDLEEALAENEGLKSKLEAASKNGASSKSVNKSESDSKG